MQQQVNIPVPHYPWPYAVGPFAGSFNEEEIQWIDTDYTFMSEDTRKMYKKHALAEATSYMFPAAGKMELLRPFVRFMLWLTIFDDYYELCPLHELRGIRDHVMDVMLGAPPEKDDIGLVRQVALSRDEFRPYANDYWFERWAKGFYRYITYGVMEETPYKHSDRYPTVDNLLMIREYSISMYTFGEPVELSIGYIVPRHISEHPVIERSKALMCRIIAIQNDLASLRKELDIKSEKLNIVIVLQHEHNISLEEACKETMRIHDDYVNELERLHKGLSHFSFYDENVEKFIYHMKLMISGLGVWYYKGHSVRYAGSKNFPVPEYGKN